MSNRHTSVRSMFHETAFAPTPGYFFQKAFCWKCLQDKKAKGGTKVGPLRRFTCADCLAAASKVDESGSSHG